MLTLHLLCFSRQLIKESDQEKPDELLIRQSLTPPLEESFLTQNTHRGTEDIGLPSAALRGGTVQGPTTSSTLSWTMATSVTLLVFANATKYTRKAGDWEHSLTQVLIYSLIKIVLFCIDNNLHVHCSEIASMARQVLFRLTSTTSSFQEGNFLLHLSHFPSLNFVVLEQMLSFVMTVQ